MRERIEAKLVLLKAQRDQLVVNLQQHDGAIAVLEDLLTQEPTPPDERPRDS